MIYQWQRMHACAESMEEESLSRLNPRAGVHGVRLSTLRRTSSHPPGLEVARWESRPTVASLCDMIAPQHDGKHS